MPPTFPSSALQLDSTIKRFAELGLKVQITALDIPVYPKEHNAREKDLRMKMKHLLLNVNKSNELFIK